jgi:squalene synthase HpnC
MQMPVELEIAQDLPPAGSSLKEARNYTRRLATRHYENFTVASYLLPRALRQHFYNMYAYCRWADDLGDEVAGAARALELLDWWEQELNQCYSGAASHPVFIALRETIDRFEIPAEPFLRLLAAFRQDQSVHRYMTRQSVLDYCRCSANPVGHLVLYLFGYRDAERQKFSDYTCTALQLANFWQDVSRDLDKDRIYIPFDDLASNYLNESDLFARRFDERYVFLMRDLIAWTRDLFNRGLPLIESVDPVARIDIELFSRGGLAVLDSIEAIDHDTLRRRPTLSKATKIILLGRAFRAHALSKLARRSN